MDAEDVIFLDKDAHSSDATKEDASFSISRTHPPLAWRRRTCPSFKREDGVMEESTSSSDTKEEGNATEEEASFSRSRTCPPPV